MCGFIAILQVLQSSTLRLQGVLSTLSRTVGRMRQVSGVSATCSSAIVGCRSLTWPPAISLCRVAMGVMSFFW